MSKTSSISLDPKRAFWTLPEAVSWSLFGDPLQPLPSRGETVEEIALAEAEAIAFSNEDARSELVSCHAEIKSEVERIINDAAHDPQQAPAIWADARARRDRRHLLAMAERKLATAVQARRVVAYGRRAPSAFGRPSNDIRHSEIEEVDLIGTLIVDGALCPPGESWLIVTDRITGECRAAWYDVQVPADQIRAELPIPLVGEQSPEEPERELDHELWLMARADAYRRLGGTTLHEEMMGWTPQEIRDWYLGEHPTLAERIHRHIENGTCAAVVLELREEEGRIRKRRGHSAPQEPPVGAPDTPQAEIEQPAEVPSLLDEPAIADWYADWKPRHPLSSETEELAAVQDRFPDKKITRELIRAMRRPPDGMRLPGGRKRGKKVTASPL